MTAVRPSGLCNTNSCWKKALIITLFHVSSIIHSRPAILLINNQGLFSKFSKNRVFTKRPQAGFKEYLCFLFSV